MSPTVLMEELPHGWKTACSSREARCEIPEEKDRWLKSLHPDLKWVTPSQVHGVAIASADVEKDGVEADALYGSGERGMGVFGSDCPGVAIVAPDFGALAHCGWRGSSRRFLLRLSILLGNYTKVPAGEWTAFIGPGICASCYEVDDQVLSARTWPDAAVREGRPGHALLDLKKVLELDCLEIGIKDVRKSDLCTRCDSRLVSYREEGKVGSQLLALWKP